MPPLPVLTLTSYITGQQVPIPTTDEEAYECLPQDELGNIKGTYQCRRGMGETIVEALASTHQVYIEIIENKRNSKK
jgi:hypothetical protein